MEDANALAASAQAYREKRQLLPALDYPDAVRVAVSFTCDFDAMLLRRLMEEPPLQRAQGEFGGRVGIWRLIELFDSHEIKATIFTPGRICELYPRALQHAAASGHEIADHMWEHRVPKDRELERDHLRKSTAAIERTDFASRRALLAMPYYYAFDDQFFLMFPSRGTGLEHADALFANWKAEMEAQYERGRHFTMTLHPHAVGWGHRLKLLDDFLARVRDLDGIWNPTSAECADWWLETFPASSTLRLEPPIWQDYEGSLS